MPFTRQCYLFKYTLVDCIEGMKCILQKESFPDPWLLFMHWNYFSMKQKFKYKNSEHEKHRSKLTVFEE